MNEPLAGLPDERRPAGPRLLLALATAFVLVQAGIEFYHAAPLSGGWLGKLSWKWGLGYLIFSGGLGLLLALALALIFRPRRLAAVSAAIVAWRRRFPGLVGVAALAALAPPAILLLPWVPLPPVMGALLGGAYIRLLIGLACAALVAITFTRDAERPIGLLPFLGALAVIGSVYVVFERLGNISGYPFTLTWSEGNRMFEFSLRINPGQYLLADPDTPRNTGVGREILWGLPFLIPGAPIWVHRAWDAILWTAPNLLLGYALARRTPLGRAGRWLFAAWTLIFLSQGPIYAPLVISAAAVALLVWPSRVWASAAAAPPANYFAAASRWTWLPAPAAWSGMLLLDDFKLRPGEPWLQTAKRLAPIAAVVGLSLAGGLLSNPALFLPQTLSSGDTFSQPLLWRRLLPNPVYPEGILLALLLAAGPLCALLIWLARARRWALNWLQALAYAAVALVFLGGGVVVSVKIGGGNNLHNLDMFLITLTFLSALALRGVDLRQAAGWPAWGRGLLILACLLPAWKALQLQRPAALPPAAAVEQALETIRGRAARAQKRGEVLFIDQRQLFTFGRLPQIPVVTAYEKRYLMDKAMAADAKYFRRFYRDLADKRFALIVIEPLYDRLQSGEFSFQEENNAWVTWVSRPLLCFYAPVETLGEVRTQMLVPREDIQGCLKYLAP